MSTDYREFKRLAYRKAILEAVQRFVQEHVATDLPAVAALHSEDVLVCDRDVPDDAFHDYLDEVRAEQEALRLQMSEFEFRRKESRAEKPKEEVAEKSNG